MESMEQHGTSKTREVTFERCQMAMRDAFIEGWREHPAAATRTLTSLAKAGSLELQLFDQIKGETHRNTCLPLCRHWLADSSHPSGIPYSHLPGVVGGQRWMHDIALCMLRLNMIEMLQLCDGQPKFRLSLPCSFSATISTLGQLFTVASCFLALNDEGRPSVGPVSLSMGQPDFS